MKFIILLLYLVSYGYSLNNELNIDIIPSKSSSWQGYGAELQEAYDNEMHQIAGHLSKDNEKNPNNADINHSTTKKRTTVYDWWLNNKKKRKKNEIGLNRFITAKSKIDPTRQDVRADYFGGGPRGDFHFPGVEEEFEPEHRMEGPHGPYMEQAHLINIVSGKG